MHAIFLYIFNVALKSQSFQIVCTLSGSLSTNSISYNAVFFCISLPMKIAEIFWSFLCHQCLFWYLFNVELKITWWERVYQSAREFFPGMYTYVICSHMYYFFYLLKTNHNPQRRRRNWQPTPVFLPGKIVWMEEPGRLRSMGLQRVGHNWATNTNTTHSINNNCHPHYTWI